MLKILSQMSTYIVNNRRAPYNISTFETFIKNYVVSEKIENDPDGSKYSFKFNGECKSGDSSCWGSKNEKNTKKPTEFDHMVYYFNNATCSSDDEVVYASGNKNVVIYYVLEGEDKVICNSNN